MRAALTSRGPDAQHVATFDAAKEEEKELEDSQAEKLGIQRDYYLDEVLSITADYVGALSDNTVAHAR
jgi:hypothetical protein